MNKKIGLLFILVASSFQLIAQLNKLSVGAFFSYDLYKNAISNNSYEKLNNSTNRNNGNALGFRVQYQLNKKINVNAGLNYAVKEYDFDWNYNSLLGQVNPKLTSITTKFADLILMPYYTFKNKNKWKFGLATGFKIGKLISSNELTTNFDNSVTNTTYFNVNRGRLLWSWQSNLVAEYLFSKHISINFEPNITYVFNHLSGDISNAHQVVWGSIFGVNYHIHSNTDSKYVKP